MKVTKCLYCGSAKLVQVTYRTDDMGILECGRCKVMMVAEISDDTKSLYTKDYFEKDTATKLGYSDYISSPVANLYGKYAFARLFASGTRHVDLGSADGSLQEIFSQNGYDTYGLEISQDAVEIAQKKGLKSTVTNLHKFPEDVKDVDIITAYDLLEHADQPGLVLKNVHASLRRGGVFVFSTLSVKKKDPTDYWFGNSLEHYIYYNKISLINVLTDVFGAGNFGFVEETINGIAEFWGFGIKGDGAAGNEIIDLLRSGRYSEKPEMAYFMSLFYNQVSNFETSEKIISAFRNVWNASLRAEAVFYHYYVQGRLAKALEETRDIRGFVPATNGVFWQALYAADHDLMNLEKIGIQKESEAEITGLREQVFSLRDELYGIKNSRVFGRLLNLRNHIGRLNDPQTRSLPLSVLRGIFHKAKVIALAPLSKDAKKKLVILKQKSKLVASSVREKIGRSAIGREVILVQGEAWSEALPLISVVVPYYNRADTIDETLQSLTTQTYQNFEVIIIDDGSTDKTSREKFTTLKDSFYNLNIIAKRQKNQGVAKARNNGISEARGKYIICLDSDDILNPAYIEKCLLILETDQDASLVTTDRLDFGVRGDLYHAADYDPARLITDNMVTTAATFRKAAWERSDGYKSGIGYEDWDYWLTLAENGDWGRSIHEPLFEYRVALNSRFVEDKGAHWDTVKAIKSGHKNYHKKIKAIVNERKGVSHIVNPDSAFVNLSNPEHYRPGTKPNIMVAIPWMTFGGAETLIYNYCREIKDQFNLSFVTGIESKHEWEYKFREISENIYHLPELFPDKTLYLEFLSNYIKTRHVSILHIIHSGFVFDMLPELKRRHPALKVAVTMFNDRVDEYVSKTVKYEAHVDYFNADSSAVAKSFEQKFSEGTPCAVIPNGINCFDEYNPALFTVDIQRKKLGMDKNDIGIFFVGRLSVEKNPDVYLDAAEDLAKKTGSKRLKYFIIGDGPMRDAVVEGIKSTKSADITFLGYQSDVAQYLSAADIFVLPSSIEGFPLSVLEAMAMKVVPIASNVGAIPDVIKNGINGYIIDPAGSKDSLVEILEVITRKPGVLDPIKAKARDDVVEKYSNVTLGRNYARMYKELMK